MLAAGKGTRFGTQPKCIQPVLGLPLACHSLLAFQAATQQPDASNTICLVGYRHEEVRAALGPGPAYILSANPAGGTAFAVFEAFATPGLLEEDPLVVITMGDRVVPTETFRRLLALHQEGPREADLTLLTARYEPPRHLGKGRILRDESGRVVRIIEEKDIAAEPNATTRQALLQLTEGNCPLYAVRARRLHQLLAPLTNDNAQGQFYLTDIVAALAAHGSDIRTLTTEPLDPAYDLLCADVTRPADLALLEGVMRRQAAPTRDPDEVARAAAALRHQRPSVQIAAIARQLEELLTANEQEKLGCDPDAPVALGISGGRLRIAFMHPDMARFYGPAWQMPIGAGSPEGSEQIVVLAQSTKDHRLHLFPLNAKFRESINHLPADDAAMFPGQNVSDWQSYEDFGNQMSETLLLSLGYFSDEELETRRQRGLPLPPASVRVSSNLRRPFALVANALASFRTLRDGHLGARVQRHLDRAHFSGLRLLCVGNIPQGGFSSSSALTVATKNALNQLFHLKVPEDVLVHLACQAEYGTGVRAGSLDQATEQKGIAHQGTLISSNPADNYRTLGTYPVPTDRFKVIFPNSVERDRSSWRWSWRLYAETAGAAGDGILTSTEWRKLTGKAAEIAAILTRLPLTTDFFRLVEPDLLAHGTLSLATRRQVAALLRSLPLFLSRDDLSKGLQEQREAYARELAQRDGLPLPAALAKTDATFGGLLTGWREPAFAHLGGRGIPLRAMVAYLFSEVAKNFHLIHHPEEWIACVTRSQWGDRSIAIEPSALPPPNELETSLPWEAGLTGPALLAAWLERHGARPYDFNQGLDDAALAGTEPPEFHLWRGGSFFRGLALIDLAEAMLQRAFGPSAVAVRVNAAGQGDYFQVHLDTRQVDPERVKEFLRRAYYARFGLNPDPEFVETHPGGGAVGVRLSQYRLLPELIAALEEDGGR
jgi:CTP:molybdopterin cytidylyltransferase MocA